jgi:MoxR-like ATPase
VGLSERNPFVGPRPIQQGEPLYGRDAEVRELFNLLQARRIVVLHSPSGAGKSSLVQAGLIPRLVEGRFDVWKPIRVNFDPHGPRGRAGGHESLSAERDAQPRGGAAGRAPPRPGQLARLDLARRI